MAFGLVAPKSLAILAHILRAALNFAISSKKLLCALKKNDNRCPKTLMSKPFAMAASLYAFALAKVNAIS